MNWFRRLFKIKSISEQTKEILEAYESEHQSEIADVLSHIDQALKAHDYMTQDEARHIKNSADQIRDRKFSSIFSVRSIDNTLRSLWCPSTEDSDVLYSLSPEESTTGVREPALTTWSLELTDEFVKSTGSLDRKLQGRIFVALRVIATKPTDPRGNTIKALSNDLSGLWRYRLGDFRLIYKPDRPSMRVYLLSFGSRGTAYH